MIIEKYGQLDLEQKYPEVLSTLRDGDVFFDIETLGLSAKIHPIYLLGCGRYQAGKVEITLFFSPNREYEAELLGKFLEYIRGTKRLITFNGDRFDLPFVLERGKKAGLDLSFLMELESLDILKRVRKLKKLLGLERCNQTAVEAFLGINRVDEYDGGKLIEVYKAYEAGPTAEAEYALLQHNLEDVRGMAGLLEILAYEKIREIHIEILDGSPKIEGDTLHICGQTNLSLPRKITLHLEEGHFCLDGSRVSAVFFLEEGKLRYYYPDPREYRYHIEEEILLPKALARSIPKEKLRKVEKEECYTLVAPEQIGAGKLASYMEGILQAAG